MDPLNDSYNAALFCNRAAAFMKLKDYKSALQGTYIFFD